MIKETMMDFKVPQFNFFQQPVIPTAPIGTQGAQGVNGTPKAGGAFTTSGGSAVDRELADMKRFIPAYNGTGELRPNNAEAGAKLAMLYA